MQTEHKIFEALRSRRLGLTVAELIKELRVPRKERSKLEDKLRDLDNRGLVRRVKTRYLLPPQSDLMRGRFQTRGRGFGFVVPEGGTAGDVFVPARFAKNAADGDTVEVLFSARGRKGLPEGRVVRILKKERKRILGLYAERGGRPFLSPFDFAGPEEIPLASRGGFFPKPGMIVEAERGSLEITGVFGLPDDPGVDAKVVIRQYGLADRFPPDAAAGAEEAAGRADGDAEDGIERADFRNLTTFTIDGATAQDFDDAVSIEDLGRGRRRLGVHIADVSYYVRPETALDRDAYSRATSVYFPGLTLPMLPERLSNDVCSLRPREDRRAFSVLLDYAPDGSIERAAFTPSLIRTAERLTYDAVARVFDGDAGERARLARIVPDLLEMRELAALLRRRRLAQGSLDFDLVEPELVYSEGRLEGVAAFVRNDAHKLIEEFMVAANVAVAAFLDRKGVPSIYRIHPRPAETDLDKLKEMLAHFGIMLPPADAIASRDLQAALDAAEGKTNGKFIHVQVLRAMRIAAYSDENIGHYGLAQVDYTHFTSPIRRYPDLIVHRVLKAALRGRKYEGPDLALSAKHCSDLERRADAAEKDLIEWRIFRLLKAKLGEELTGVVVDISKAGLVIALDEYFVEGVAAYADLGNEYFRRKSPVVLAGRKTGRKYELGQEIRVLLAAVDPMLRRMTLIPV